MTSPHRAATRRARPVRLLPLLLLSGCGAAACEPGGGQPMSVYTLYGSLSGRAGTTEAAWRSFRDGVITPTLPDGYTVLDGIGAWRPNGSATTRSEPTIILIVALPAAGANLDRINRIRAAWQQQFGQKVVGMTEQSACGSFSPMEAPR